MHQSPLKQIGAPRREKYATDLLDDSAQERRVQRGSPPRARRFQERDDSPRGDRPRQHPRG